MKEVVINGVEYFPASALTKQFRYTTDYIGQLCRAKKVDAQLIGRSWYVNPISLAEHKKNRHTKAVVKDVPDKVVNPVHKETVAIDIDNHKLLKRVSVSTDKNFAKRISWKPLRYEMDEQELLPSLNKSTSARKITINLADSTDISIKEATKSTSMVAESMPTVSLSGDLRVISAEDDFEKFGLDDEKIDLAEIPLPPITPRLVKATQPMKRPFYLKKIPSELIEKPELKPRSKAAERKAPVELKIPPVKVVPVKETYNFLQKIMVSLIAITAVFLIMLFFTELVVEGNSNSHHWSLVFSWSSFTNFLH